MDQRFGKYRLVRKLAQGGMAEVFLATVEGEAGFRKQVVIKRLHPHLSVDQQFVKMLVDEARITARLQHSNICQVFDLGCEGDSYYLALEYIAGMDLLSLQIRCKERGVEIPFRGGVFIVSEILAGLDYAHSMRDLKGRSLGIVHRDVSPQNILISFEGEVKLIDFGIAKARERNVHTREGIIKGKCNYMSPEQACGQPLDHRADIFSTGVLLYELLRGEPYADASNDMVVLRMRQAGHSLEPISHHRPDVPQELQAIVTRALQPVPDRRFVTAEDFRNALTLYLRRTRSRFDRAELGLLVKRVYMEDAGDLGQALGLEDIPTVEEDIDVISDRLARAGAFEHERTESLTGSVEHAGGGFNDEITSHDNLTREATIPRGAQAPLVVGSSTTNVLDDPVWEGLRGPPEDDPDEEPTVGIRPPRKRR